jgi:hypothetical protein
MAHQPQPEGHANIMSWKVLSMTQQAGRQHSCIRQGHRDLQPVQANRPGNERSRHGSHGWLLGSRRPATANLEPNSTT